MDSKSPSPVAQIQMVEDTLPSLTENRPTGLTGRQERSRPQLDFYVGHVTGTQPEKIDLTKDSSSDDDTKREDMLNHRPASQPKPVLELIPAKMLERPPSTGRDLSSGFSYQRPKMPAMNFSRSPKLKSSAYRKPDDDLPKHGMRTPLRFLHGPSLHSQYSITCSLLRSSSYTRFY